MVPALGRRVLDVRGPGRIGHGAAWHFVRVLLIVAAQRADAYTRVPGKKKRAQISKKEKKVQTQDPSGPFAASCRTVARQKLSLVKEVGKNALEPLLRWNGEQVPLACRA